MAKTTNGEGETTAAARRYPFYDLDNCIAVARALHDVGGGTLTIDQLVPATGHKGKSGSFLTKLASARLFGLIGGSDDGKIRITDRGTDIVAPLQPGITDRQAKRDAFLAVPVFDAIFRAYPAKPLPPKEGLLSALKSVGVPASQLEFAYRSLKSSAGTAGFLEQSGGEMTRLVQPIIADHLAGAGGKPKQENKSDRLQEPKVEISAPRSVRGAVDMLPAEGSTITAIKLNGLVEAYRTALLMAYEVVKDDGA